MSVSEREQAKPVHRERQRMLMKSRNIFETKSRLEVTDDIWKLR